LRRFIDRAMVMVVEVLVNEPSKLTVHHFVGLGGDTCKGIRNDRDQQVEHHYDQENGSCNEEKPREPKGLLIKGRCIELA
jgi:hypothetical protein